MKIVQATRYVTPMREGGSLPAVIEADDEGLYLLKFSGAGQGPKALIAEWVAGAIGRACGLPIPEIVLVELDPELARTEPDPEIQDLIRASAGLNLALDYLPGSVTYDPLAMVPDGELASRIVWFDALISNVDRTARNTNMLVWHRQLYLIDHGAAFYMHHHWGDIDTQARDPFARIRDHVLLPLADSIEAADAHLSTRLMASSLDEFLVDVPDAWLSADAAFKDVDSHRRRYVEHLARRLQAPRPFVQEILRARAALV